MDIKITEKNGRSVASLGVMSTDDVVVITKGGLLVRVPCGDIRECGRGSQGVRVASLNEGDAVISAARVEEGESTAEPEAGAIQA